MGLIQDIPIAMGGTLQRYSRYLISSLSLTGSCEFMVKMWALESVRERAWVIQALPCKNNNNKLKKI